MTVPLPADAPADWLELTQCLLDSFRKCTGRELIARTTPAEELLTLWKAPRVVAFHDTQDDPVFRYGNLAAFRLWELPLKRFLGMPSRQTAEPIHRDERQRLLQRTSELGYVDDYRGIRISSTGKRFLIEQAILWTVRDPVGQTLGQAATFDRWTPLPESPPLPD
ncbi:MAG: MEKHLA domain-containing protein [Planctomycetaceae bacterium]|nr:MAG: MEKHLA domain-containing protein [Planctomycetaceae bacterium]